MKTSTHHDGGSHRPLVEPPVLAIPMGRVAGCSLYFSYSLLIALGIVVGIVATFAGNAGNKDLAFASTIAVVIWAIGCFFQAAAYRLGLGANHHFIEIGLIGTRWSSGKMSAKRTLQTSVMTVSVMLAIGSSLLLASRWSRDRFDPFDVTQSDVRTGQLEHYFAIPGFDLESPGALLELAGWLFLIQIAVQMFPLPRSLGRHLLASAVLSLGMKERGSEVRWIHRGLILSAVFTALFAFAMLRSNTPLFVPRWPLLLLVSIWLVRTSRMSSVQNLVNAFSITADEEASEFGIDEAGESGRESFHDSIGSKARSWISRRKLRRALTQEHQEAVDASKLDAILERLHRDGVEGLSRDDQDVLRRVSEALKKAKQR
ncbi:hypothetical protein Q31b_22090 [Novipirellula aureliae]|uniref:Uncharacterized protein n=1 Tax=Novipirellula aureliae TaxID=2527966 RepID=A0A5C6E6A9_9BACT|nr:hypothetical protein [Novipirellula aureliae]TWU43171.1 hypothetical protein Q31b_22090 [Novipirellula aureliae]